MNGFIGLMTPLLVGVAAVDPNATPVAQSAVAEAIVQKSNGGGTPLSWPVIAAPLPHDRPALASRSVPRSQTQTILVKSDALRSSQRAASRHGTLTIEAASAAPADKEYALLRRSAFVASAHESYTSNAIDRDGVSESDGHGESLRVTRLNHVPSDLMILNLVVKSADGTTAAQSIAAKHAPLPVDQPAVFAKRLEQHISVMLTNHVHHARIAVSPPELGPVEARVTVIGDQATVQLVSPHAATREALEDALPQLRSLFDDGGLALGHAGVFSETPTHHPGQSATRADDAHVEARAPDGAPALPNAVKIRLGLIDAYA